MDHGIIQYVNGYYAGPLTTPYHESVLRSLKACDMEELIVAVWKIKSTKPISFSYLGTGYNMA